MSGVYEPEEIDQMMQEELDMDNQSTAAPSPTDEEADDGLVCQPVDASRNSIAGNSMQKLGQCVICFDDFASHQECIQLPDCAHFFHAGCIQTWLRRVQTCPHCRR